ncbi:MAG: 2'-5' RNA ligase family protein [Deinococcus sp.]|nr:2'-5' RNA ligase family protein [Deinococcus sp.]
MIDVPTPVYSVVAYLPPEAAEELSEKLIAFRLSRYAPFYHLTLRSLFTPVSEQQAKAEVARVARHHKPFLVKASGLLRFGDEAERTADAFALQVIPSPELLALHRDLVATLSGTPHRAQFELENYVPHVSLVSEAPSKLSRRASAVLTAGQVECQFTLRQMVLSQSEGESWANVAAFALGDGQPLPL